MGLTYLKNVTTLRLDRDRCTGCGMCLDVCPHGVFEMQDRRAAISDADLCMECGACKKNCPVGAIEVREGVGCAYALLRSQIFGGKPSCGCSDADESTESSTGCCSSATAERSKSSCASTATGSTESACSSATTGSSKCC